jgi:hypothetical protein
MNAQHDQVSDGWRAHRTYLVDLAFRTLGDTAIQDLCPTSAAAYCPEYVQ